MTEEMNEIIVLNDEDGEEFEFEVMAAFEDEGESYAVLLPVDEDYDELLILKIVEDEEGVELLCDIEDDEEWERVVKVWEELSKEI